jgi:hypothetical protein
MEKSSTITTGCCRPKAVVQIHSDIALQSGVAIRHRSAGFNGDLVEYRTTAAILLRLTYGALVGHIY